MKEHENDAETTVKFAIFLAISENWYTQNPRILRDKIFEEIFKPDVKWAVEEYLNLTKSKKNE